MDLLRKLNVPKILRIFLILIGIHSFVVGVNLISFPSEWMQKFGFNPITENFFKVQGGVFHIVMVVAYFIAAWNPVKFGIMVIFAFTVKLLATIFLVTYYFIDGDTIVILLSAISDFIMGIILLFLFLRMEIKKELEN